MKTMKATQGQTHVFHEQEQYKVINGVVEVPDALAEILTSHGFEEVKKPTEQPKKK